MTINIIKHHLVPKHTKVSDSEKEKLFKEYGVSVKEFPKLISIDPVAVSLGAKVGDLIKIERKSETAGVSIYYRIVIER